MDTILKKLKLVRNKTYGVGKKMGYQTWLHKNYIDSIMTKENYDLCKSQLSNDFDFTILRWDAKKEELAFIQCDDFDTAKEPIVGMIQKVSITSEGVVRGKDQKQNKDPMIYHHKWMFVKDNYEGFDVEESKCRSVKWKEELGVDRSLSSKIGRLSFWENLLVERNLEKRKN